MAHAKRSQQHRVPSSSISSPFPRRNLRRPTTTTATPNSHTSLSSPALPNHRPVLVPLQPNLRRLPSRILLAQKDLPQLMRDSGHVITTGSKRKRVLASNENAHTHGRPVRGSGRLKRLRSNGCSSTSKSCHLSTSEESGSQASDMDVDTPAQLSASDASEIDQEHGEVSEDQEEGDDEDDSTDDHLIHSAPRNQLNRLRKSDLVRLYDLAGFTEDADTLTKSDIIDAIVNARDDFASAPPSSPLGRADGASSECSSDDGNVAGDEETDFAGPRRGPHGSPLKRRVTLNDLGKSTTRPVKARNMSMDNLLTGGEVPLKRKASTRSEIDNSEPATSRRRTSSRTSPIIAATRTITDSPPAHRLRSRNASHSVPNPNTPTSSGTSKSKGKGKSKQVEFSDAVQIHAQSPSKRSARGKEHDPEESDLTELEELEKTSRGQLSPRRLRSKDRELEKSKGKEKADPDATPVAISKRKKQVRSAHVNEQADSNDVRVTPTRKVKGKIGTLKESDMEHEETEEERDELEDDENVVSDIGEDAEQEQEEEEVDELVSSASITPPPESRGRRTPLRRRLRPRKTRNKTAYEEDAENEGDDEEEDENEEDEDEAEDQREQEEDEEQEGGDEAEVGDEDDEATIAVEPRKLRNGKIVGEEDIEMEVDEDIGDEDEEDEDGEEEEEEEAVEEVADADNIDIDAEGETDEDEIMEDDVDLTVATTKTLIRLRRDDLVRLCETRDLVPAGSKPTKPQLAEALLQWRDRQTNDFSSPSSGGTIRPSSNRKLRRTKHHSSSTNTAIPVSLHSETHTDESRAPIPGKEKDKENEELELDLESLGLEDREIPPEKLTKLEKIGSGGFKDVYIGKFKGRKIAISEFRGQLSAMDIKELKLLGAFNHPNIVRFLGVSIPENTKDIPVMIVSELCSNGDLFDYVRNVNAPSLHKVLQMALDIARGLEYLHTRKPSIIHRDCKSSNILVTAKGTAKIADFGLAKVKQSTRSMVRSLVGTVNWQAPELWHAHPKYNHKVDVFSCAMVYWEMLQWHLPNKKFPWEGMNEHAIYDIVGSKRQRPSIAGLRKQWCPDIVDLIERMWAHEHQDRPTMSEVVEAVQELVATH